jgi:hypothetical protein
VHCGEEVRLALLLSCNVFLDVPGRVRDGALIPRRLSRVPIAGIHRHALEGDDGK